MQANGERPRSGRGRLVDVEAGAAWPMAWPMIYLDQTDSRLPGTWAELR